MIDKMRGEIPVVIIRPSVIESTCKEPFPGWMEGNRYLFLKIYTNLLNAMALMISRSNPLSTLPPSQDDGSYNFVLWERAAHGLLS